jgi:hypothetical protein
MSPNNEPPGYALAQMTTRSNHPYSMSCLPESVSNCSGPGNPTFRRTLSQVKRAVTMGLLIALWFSIAQIAL